MDAEPDLAIHRLEAKVQTNWPQRGFAPMAIVRAMLSFVSEGAFGGGPKSRVQVIDRRSGQVILEHDWGRSLEAAERDRNSLEDQLNVRTVGEFCADHGVAPPGA